MEHSTGFGPAFITSPASLLFHFLKKSFYVKAYMVNAGLSIISDNLW